MEGKGTKFFFPFHYSKPPLSFSKHKKKVGILNLKKRKITIIFTVIIPSEYSFEHSDTNICIYICATMYMDSS